MKTVPSRVSFRLATFILASFLSGNICVASEEICARGMERLNAGEPCIPVDLRNYLYCLGKSGNGRIELRVAKEDSFERGFQVKLNGGTIAATGGAGLSKENTSRIARDVQEKLDPSLAANCKQFASVLQPSNVTRARPTVAASPAATEELQRLRSENQRLSQQAQISPPQIAASQAVPSTSPSSIVEKGLNQFEFTAFSRVVPALRPDAVGNIPFRMEYRKPSTLAFALEYEITVEEERKSGFASLSLAFSGPQDFSNFNYIELEYRASSVTSFDFCLWDIANKQWCRPFRGDGIKQYVRFPLPVSQEPNLRAIQGIYFVASRPEYRTVGKHFIELLNFKLVK